MELLSCRVWYFKCHCILPSCKVKVPISDPSVSVRSSCQHVYLLTPTCGCAVVLTCVSRVPPKADCLIFCWLPILVSTFVTHFSSPLTIFLLDFLLFFLLVFSSSYILFIYMCCKYSPPSLWVNHSLLIKVENFKHM